jgi:hypothetical protein
LWLFLSSFGHSFKFFGKSALFVNSTFEQLPQLSFGIARGQQVCPKVVSALSFPKMCFQNSLISKQMNGYKF